MVPDASQTCPFAAHRPVVILRVRRTGTRRDKAGIPLLGQKLGQILLSYSGVPADSAVGSLRLSQQETCRMSLQPIRCEACLWPFRFHVGQGEPDQNAA